MKQIEFNIVIDKTCQCPPLIHIVVTGNIGSEFMVQLDNVDSVGTALEELGCVLKRYFNKELKDKFAEYVKA